MSTSLHLAVSLSALLLAAFTSGFSGDSANALARVQEASKGAAYSPREKELLAEFNKAFSDPDPAARAAALETLGERTRGLPDKGIGKSVAKALVKGLEDDELEVRDAAVWQLGYGRDVDTVIAGLGALLEDIQKGLERHRARTDAESLDYVSRGSVVYTNGCIALATYHDDRSVSILVRSLAALRASKDGDDPRWVGRLAEASLALGTLDAVVAAVKQTQTFSVPKHEPSAQKLHEALSAFATKLGAAPPGWSEDYSAAWHAWLETNQGKLPKKLGRLEVPPMNEPFRGMDGLPGKSG